MRSSRSRRSMGKCSGKGCADIWKWDSNTGIPFVCEPNAFVDKSDHAFVARIGRRCLEEFAWSGPGPEVTAVKQLRFLGGEIRETFPTEDESDGCGEDLKSGNPPFREFAEIDALG